MVAAMSIRAARTDDFPADPSLALHRALGFTEVGIVRDAGFKHDRWHDVAFWQKPLGTTAP